MLPISKAKIISYIILISIFTALLLLIVLFFVFWRKSEFDRIPSGFIMNCVLALLSFSMVGYCLKIQCNPHDSHVLIFTMLIISFFTLRNHNIRESYSFYLPFIIVFFSLFIMSFALLIHLLYSSSDPYRKKRKMLGE